MYTMALGGSGHTQLIIAAKAGIIIIKTTATKKLI